MHTVYSSIFVYWFYCARIKCSEGIREYKVNVLVNSTGSNSYTMVLGKSQVWAGVVGVWKTLDPLLSGVGRVDQTVESDRVIYAISVVDAVTLIIVVGLVV